MEKNNKSVRTTKKNKHIIKQKKESQANPQAKWVEDYVNIFTRGVTPMTDSGLERFAQDMVDWAYNNEDALRPYDFAYTKQLGRRTYMKWVNKYPVIHEAHQDVMDIIASRREIGALKRKYSEKTVLFSLHRYDPEAREDAKFHASLRDQESSGSNITINLPDITKEQ